MSTTSHLWTIGFDDVKQASKARDKIVRLGRAQNYLLLDDVAVAVRHPDGSFTLEREHLEAASNILGASAVGFLVGLVLGVPLVGAAIGAAVGGAGTAVVIASAGIAGDFIREVQALMKPGGSAISYWTGTGTST